ncbi:MAG: hypothetical protein KME43_06950 [Myxacorys chilensis ATA2-1-KO14]|nr:hypothetical protein [Myxacorys chilensis ATA2-1-KO14]
MTQYKRILGLMISVLCIGIALGLTLYSSIPNPRIVANVIFGLAAFITLFSSLEW